MSFWPSQCLDRLCWPRVIEQTIRQKLPEGFQRAEFLQIVGSLIEWWPVEISGPRSAPSSITPASKGPPLAVMLSVSAPSRDWLIVVFLRGCWWRCTPRAQFLGTALIVVCFLLLWDWQAVSGWRCILAGRAATIFVIHRIGGRIEFGGTLAGGLFHPGSSWVGIYRFWPTVLVLLTGRRPGAAERCHFWRALWMPCRPHGFLAGTASIRGPPALLNEGWPVVVGPWPLDWFRSGPRFFAVPWRWSVSGLLSCVLIGSMLRPEPVDSGLVFRLVQTNLPQDLRAGWPTERWIPDVTEFLFFQCFWATGGFGDLARSNVLPGFGFEPEARCLGAARSPWSVPSPHGAGLGQII